MYIQQKYIGRCLTCNHIQRQERKGKSACTRCSTVWISLNARPGQYASGQPGYVKWKQIKGYFSDSHKCDVRCTHAIGCNCECSCGGANHGSAWDVKNNNQEKVAA